MKLRFLIIIIFFMGNSRLFGFKYTFYNKTGLYLNLEYTKSPDTSLVGKEILMPGSQVTVNTGSGCLMNIIVIPMLRHPEYMAHVDHALGPRCYSKSYDIVIKRDRKGNPEYHKKLKLIKLDITNHKK